MILFLKIVSAAIIIGIVVFLLWFLHIVVIAITFDNDKCRKCPLKEQCQDAVTAGMPTLCNNSTPLYTHKTW